MKRFFRYVRGFAVMEICGASPGWALNKLAHGKIAFWGVTWVDAVTLRITVPLNRKQAALLLAESAMCECSIVGTYGVYKVFKKFVNRPVLTIALFINLITVLCLPYFVLFYEVQGNEIVRTETILRELEDLGIDFGVFGPDIYPRRIRDQIIKAIPQIQWLTLVQNGCRATVIVREREGIPELSTKKGLANVVASQSGIITQQSVYVGQPMFETGDIVAKGDLLVSGVVDLERTYLIERANAEIFAHTWRRLHARIPIKYNRKSSDKGRSCCLWLILGDKRIKLFGNSGISYDSCDKMIDTKVMTLPGELQLPVSIVIEYFRFYGTEQAEIQPPEAEDILLKYLCNQVEDEMIAGEILGKKHRVQKKNGAVDLHCILECHEMIAKVIEAKWSEEEFAND